MGNKLRRLKLQWILASRWLWRKKALAIRAMLAWLLALVFATFDRDNDLDLRFRIRSQKPISPEILVLNISKEESQIFKRLEMAGRVPPTATESEKQSEFWNQVIGEVLKLKPKSIGITPNSDHIVQSAIENPKLWSHLLRKNVSWSVSSEFMEKLLNSRSGQKYISNIGIGGISVDHDGLVRRYGGYKSGPSLISTLAKHDLNIQDSELESLKSKFRYINFSGPKGSITHLSLTDILSRTSGETLFGKVVLLGLETDSSFEIKTPVGQLTRAEVFANVLDNSLSNRWIQRADLSTIAIVLLALVLLAGWVMSIYPHSVALLALIWLSTLGSAVSIYIFDSACFLFPILPIWIASISTYMTFLSLQVSIRDYENQQLEKEHEFMLNVEELKNNFLSLISHDLKTPIAKLQGICDRIISKSPPAELAQDILTLRAEASELHKYIKTILQVTRVESRDFKIHVESSDLNEIIESVCEQLSPLAQAKSIQINLELEPMFLVEVDPVLIHEVILNLIENAIKYSQEGGLVTVTSREVDDHVLVMVKDKGPGIPESEHSRIFERFYRGQEGLRQSKGSGLGLYLVKYFVEMHNGQVVLESRPGHGTRIGISLPIREASAQLPKENINESFA
jgi:signal transduction histidine kinase